MASSKVLTCGLVAALSFGCKDPEPGAAAKPAAPPAPPAPGETAPPKPTASPEPDPGAPTQEPTASLGPATTEEAKLAREVECWGAVQTADWARVRRCFRDTSRWEILDGVPPSAAHGPDAIVAALEEWRTGFPDLQLSQQLKLGRGDEVAAMYILTGTHLGPFKGWPATRKRIGLHLAELATIGDDGTIHIDFLVLDERALWHQLGVRPDPAAGEVVEDAAGDRPTIIASNDAAEEAHVKALYGAIGAIDQRDSAAYGALLADSVTLRSYGDGLKADGKKAVLAAMKKRSGALLDVDHGTGRVWGAGDWVVAEVSATRTTRDRKVIPNKEVHFFRFGDAKLVEHHVFANELHTAWRRDQVRPEDLVPPAP